MCVVAHRVEQPVDFRIPAEPIEERSTDGPYRLEQVIRLQIHGAPGRALYRIEPNRP